MSLVYTPPVWESWSPEDLHALGADPATSPEVLVELWEWASFLHDDLLAVLASNPATPFDVLLELTDRHAAAVTRNPAFRLKMLTEPGFIQGLHRRVLRNIGRGRGVDPRLLTVIGQDRSQRTQVRAAVARNPDCPVPLMHAFLKHARPVREALARNSAVPSEVVASLAKDRSADVRAMVAWRDRLSREARAQLARDEDPGIRAVIARRRDTARGTLVAMAQDEWAPEVVKEIIRHHRTPIEAIVPMTRHRSLTVQGAIRTWASHARHHPLADIDPETGAIVGEAELRFKERPSSWADSGSRVPDWVLGSIIDHGWWPTCERERALQRFGFLNREPLSYWPPIAVYLHEQEYFALLRGMIFLEAALDDWRAGSVSSTISLAQNMVRMYPHRGDEVRAFVKKHCINGHIWGIDKRYEDFTPEERRLHAERELARIAQHREQEALEQALAQARAERHAKMLEQREVQRQRKAAQRARDNETLKSLCPVDRLTHIATHTHVTLAYFSPQWGQVSDDVLAEVPREVLENLSDRCRLKSSRTWAAVGRDIRRYLRSTSRVEPPMSRGPVSKLIEGLVAWCLPKKFRSKAGDGVAPPRVAVSVQVAPAPEAGTEPRAAKVQP